MEKHNELTFHLMVESSPNALVLVNQNRKIAYLNSYAERLFKYKRSEIIGMEVGILIPESLRKDHPKFMQEYFENPVSRLMGANRELLALKKDGSEFAVEIGLNPIVTVDGTFVLASIIDITERKKAEELRKLHTAKIENKNKELEQFIYIASHDLRAPLQSILSCCQLLLDEQKYGFDELALSSLNFVRDSASRMKELIDGLLDYGHIGKSAEISMVDFNKVLKDVCDDLSFDIQNSMAKIKIGNLPIMDAYATEIRLLFQNLISNAIKFRKKEVHPEIFIRAAKVNNFWKFEIEDNGIGIPTQYRDKIFVIFQRLHKKEEYEGLGIGLAHCRKIVELHNGEIGVNSDLEKGSTFYFSISNNLSLI